MAEEFDLVIRNGTIFDGLGGESVEGDVAVRDGLIARVGEIDGRGVEEIDANGAIVTPGFVDLHTHYDGQAVWSSRLNPSSSHGITTVLAGNCGVGFAPCRPADRERLVSVMEGVEDIPEVVMTNGLTWDWETFPEFLEAVARRPHDIDVGFYLPHAALRVYVMGERAVRHEPSTPEDREEMYRIACEALEAGAMGFSTSNTPAHRAGGGEEFIPTYEPDYAAAEIEYLAIAQAIRDTGRGIFQMVVDLRHAEGPPMFIGMLERISKAGNCTALFSWVVMDSHPELWREIMTLLDEANARPEVRIKAQIFPRPIGVMMGLETTLNPFALCPSYMAIGGRPLAERVAIMRDPAFRAKTPPSRCSRSAAISKRCSHSASPTTNRT